MARRTATITIDAKGRDEGKRFLLTEMSADQAEAWAMRALLALTNAGVELPDEVLSAGMAGIATIGIRALGKLSYTVAAPLLAEMMDCVQIVMPAATRPLLHGDGGDIEEVKTRLTLRLEVFKLHLDPSLVAAIPTTASGRATA